MSKKQNNSGEQQTLHKHHSQDKWNKERLNIRHWFANNNIATGRKIIEVHGNTEKNK